MTGASATGHSRRSPGPAPRWGWAGVVAILATSSVSAILYPSLLRGPYWLLVVPYAAFVGRLCNRWLGLGLVALLRKYRYNDALIYREYPFLIKDVFFSAVLVAATYLSYARAAVAVASALTLWALALRKPGRRVALVAAAAIAVAVLSSSDWRARFVRGGHNLLGAGAALVGPREGEPGAYAVFGAPDGLGNLLPPLLAFYAAGRYGTSAGFGVALALTAANRANDPAPAGKASWAALAREQAMKAGSGR